jgi:peptidoglycan/xylan/chitin deacetylase (PgdA/CDA1 family)
MLEFLIIPTLLVFLLFLVLGVASHFKGKGGQWIYFTLSALFLIGVMTMYTLSHWNLADNGKGEKNTTPKTEESEKPTGNGQENQTDPIKENPPPKETLPSEDQKEEPITPVSPSDPVVAPPAAPEKIIVPENGIVAYKVVKGDTLWAISIRSGMTIEKVRQWNNLKSDVIYLGQILKLYGKNVQPPPSVIEPPQEKPPTENLASVLISNGGIQQKKIALTFDAGSDAAGIRILDVLKKHNVRATFFLTGKWAEKFPDYASRIAADGHDIGNHTYSHPDAVTTTTSAFAQDIMKAEQAIKTATGKSPRPYFRFPYGSYNAVALKAVGGAGYPLSIQWSLDTIDWQQPTTEVIISRIENGASNGDIILMHIGGINTPEAVDKVIPWLKAQGYQLVALSELLK